MDEATFNVVPNGIAILSNDNSTIINEKVNSNNDVVQNVSTEEVQNVIRNSNPSTID